ncbi:MULTISPECIES: hypothetical protein [unclassified Streptomyces]|uniref:hypothetical protein n=1 Tax=unclassified Streptomyces TaxID=2593676 RepID=UPI00225685FE|nr:MULTISPECIES: hypothetical protein [unclassified Streptomyces]MCX5054680.1 hypothetical protein [Streptomyces sp. NBC_00474]
MDEGLVALVTAGVGLVGAIAGAAVGGMGAIRGARIGAQTAAEATAKQVRDQSVVDHEHWLRGERLAACRNLLTAYSEYAVAASNMARVYEGSRPGDVQIGLTMGASVTRFRDAYFQLRILGPDEVRAPALRFGNHVEAHNECITTWGDAIARLDAATVMEVEAAAAEEERLRLQFSDLHDAFVEAATQAMTRRPTNQ